jgi:hypothetical protein
MEMYPPSTLHGKKDPDYSWLGTKMLKSDLNIISVPSGLTATTVYGYGNNYRKMVCKTPCKVGIIAVQNWSIRISDGPNMFIASQFPEPVTGFIKNMYFRPDTIVFKSAEGLENQLANAQADCETEGKKKGSIKHTNCVALKMESVSR